jgi:hypothetical protein
VSDHELLMSLEPVQVIAAMLFGEGRAATTMDAARALYRGCYLGPKMRACLAMASRFFPRAR